MLASVVANVRHLLHAQLLVSAENVEHAKGGGGCAAGLLNADPGAGLGAAVDGDGLAPTHQAVAFLVVQGQPRQADGIGLLGPQLFHHHVSRLPPDAAKGLANPTAGNDQHPVVVCCLRLAHSFFAASSAWPCITTRYCSAANRLARSASQSLRAMRASQPWP